MAALYIDAHGTRVGHQMGRLTLKLPDGTESDYPIEQVERVIVIGHAHFSHDAIAALLRHDIATVFSQKHGGLRGFLSAGGGRQIGRRTLQIDAARSPDRALEAGKALVQAKLRGQSRLLGHWRVEGRAQIARALRATCDCSNLASLRGHEGEAARHFFAGLRAHLAGSPFVFDARRQHPAPDPVNAALSLGYTLLSGEVATGVASFGLEPCAGFFHASENGRTALIYDLVEPLRPIVDRLVARMLRHDLAPEDFRIEDRACRFVDGRRGVFYRAWEGLLDARLHWRGEATTYRRLIHLQAGEIANWLDGTQSSPRFWYLDDNCT
jgi:CRISP-associated protein Cas1